MRERERESVCVCGKRIQCTCVCMGACKPAGERDDEMRKTREMRRIEPEIAKVNIELTNQQATCRLTCVRVCSIPSHPIPFRPCTACHRVWVLYMDGEYAAGHAARSGGRFEHRRPARPSRRVGRYQYLPLSTLNPSTCTDGESYGDREEKVGVMTE